MANTVIIDVKTNAGKANAEIEKLNPNTTNLVLCGGRDSLNLLLLSWENSTIAVSAEPNYPLVCEFIKNNNLDIKTIRLDDLHDPEMLIEENLECCCRIALPEWKWGAGLRKVANGFDKKGGFDKKVIFWKGHFGDTLLTPDWKSYINKNYKVKRFFSKVYRRTSHLLPDFLKYWIGEKFLPDVYKQGWNVAALMQGAHLSFIRSLTGAHALSAYHGKHMTGVYKQVNFARALQTDIRVEIGKKLLGRDVWYPDDNPSPPLSTIRIGLHDPDQFIMKLKENGINVE